MLLELRIYDIMDEFFMPNGASFFWSFLPEPKAHRCLANAEHSMSGHQVDMYLSDVSGFVVDTVLQRPFPNVVWNITGFGTVITAQVVAPVVPPKKAIMWYHTNPTSRDFRWIVCGNLSDPNCLHPYLMKFVELDMQANYTFVASMPIPETGWTVFMIEIEFTDTGGMNRIDPLKLTSEVSIIPQTFPYAPCAACDAPMPDPSGGGPGWTCESSSSSVNLQ